MPRGRAFTHSVSARVVLICERRSVRVLNAASGTVSESDEFFALGPQRLVNEIMKVDEFFLPRSRCAGTVWCPSHVWVQRYQLDPHTGSSTERARGSRQRQQPMRSDDLSAASAAAASAKPAVLGLDSAGGGRTLRAVVAPDRQKGMTSAAW